MIVHRTALQSLADLLDDLGGISADRVRQSPPPGEATAEDWEAVYARDRLVEFIDGTLVDKASSAEASLVAAVLIEILGAFVRGRGLGLLTAPDGMYVMRAGNRRGPDVAFIRRRRLPDGKMPSGPTGPVQPDLAVEILSPGNTRREMSRKRREYFASGVRAVWIVDVENRSVAIYSDVERFTLLGEDDTLDGGDVVPGFKLPVAELFVDLAD